MLRVYFLQNNIKSSPGSCLAQEASGLWLSCLPVLSPLVASAAPDTLWPATALISLCRDSMKGLCFFFVFAAVRAVSYLQGHMLEDSTYQQVTLQLSRNSA